MVADIIDVTRTLTADPENRVPHLAFQPHSISDTPILGMAAIETAYYLRMQVSDRPGVMADVTRIIGDAGISIEAILQKEPAPEADRASIILLTHVVHESQMNASIEKIEALDSIHGRVTRIRLEHLNCD